MKISEIFIFEKNKINTFLTSQFSIEKKRKKNFMKAKMKCRAHWTKTIVRNYFPKRKKKKNCIIEEQK